MTDIRGRLEAVEDGIRSACLASGRARGDVRLVAVSKFHPASAIEEAALAGQLDFGENYVQEALAKQAALSGAFPNLRWHMIGHVQSRKAKDVAGAFALLHALDSIKLADALEKRMASGRQRVLIEVAIAGEAQKSGISPERLEELAAHVLEACPHLELRGLMCMPPVYDSGDAARPYFAKLRDLRDNLEKSVGAPLPELSMGMSGDYMAAIAEGATIVRVGTAIFGPRPAGGPGMEQ